MRSCSTMALGRKRDEVSASDKTEKRLVLATVATEDFDLVWPCLPAPPMVPELPHKRLLAAVLAGGDGVGGGGVRPKLTASGFAGGPRGWRVGW